MHTKLTDASDSSSVSPGSATRTSRRRGAELLQAIHLATSTELAENGFDAVTFDRIAHRAKMSKATIYRRYRSPAHLIAETLAADAKRVSFTPAGTLREDLVRIVALGIETINAFGVDTYRRLIGYQDESIKTLFRDGGLLAGYQLVAQSVEDARTRGEIGPSTIPESAMRTPLEILHSRILLTGAYDGLAEEIVDNAALPLFIALSRR